MDLSPQSDVASHSFALGVDNSSTWTRLCSINTEHKDSHPHVLPHSQTGTLARSRLAPLFTSRMGVKPLSGLTRPIVCREPWIVEGWLPRDYSKWDTDLRQFRTVRISGGHLAQVRSLRDRRRVKQVADWILLQSINAGLVKENYTCRKSHITKASRISRP